tara:strand:+ start:1053 stop:1589 length:537 start_codon:yes stop_codon:yes gene_type:complete
MAEQKQTIVQPAAAPNKAKGARNQSNLQSMFASSPIYLGDMSDEERKKSYQALCLDGDVNDSVEVAGVVVPGGQGNGVNAYSRDFGEAPDISQVETGGGGLPASPYMPNITSPGPGSLNAANQPEFNGTLPDGSNRSNFGSGLGGLAQPAETAKSISEQTILGAYISGKSFLGSDGKS